MMCGDPRPAGYDTYKRFASSWFARRTLVVVHRIWKNANVSKGCKGADHNPDGFTCWMTGAGVNPV